MLFFVAGDMATVQVFLYDYCTQSNVVHPLVLCAAIDIWPEILTQPSNPSEHVYHKALLACISSVFCEHEDHVWAKVCIFSFLYGIPLKLLKIEINRSRYIIRVVVLSENHVLLSLENNFINRLSLEHSFFLYMIA
jgi:hypothetical protein